MIITDRIKKENKKLLEQTISGAIVKQLDGSLPYYQFDVFGEKGTLYEGGIFETEIFFPESYPMCPPKIRFITKIFHPNVDLLGRINLDMLTIRWSPTIRVKSIIIALEFMLQFPDTDDSFVPMDSAISKSWKNDISQAHKYASTNSQDSSTDRKNFNL